MKNHLSSLLLSALFGLFLLPNLGLANDMRVAIVDLNKAINESKEGKKSKDMLLSVYKKQQAELKVKEEELKKAAAEMNNMMLSEAARAKKQQEVKEKDEKLRQDVEKAQTAYMEKERGYTMTIIEELRGVINKYADKNKYDMVLEKGLAQSVLFAKFKFEDVTDDVIKLYNSSK